MLHSSYSIVDCTQASAIATILPFPPSLSSHSLVWQGLQFAYYQQPACQTSQLYFLQHTISINIGSTVLKERFLQGKSQIDRFATGEISITPAKTIRQVRLMGNAEFIHLYLDPLFLDRLAYQSIPSQTKIIPQFKIRDPLIYQIGLTLKQELEANPQGSGFYAESAATFLAAHLIRHYCDRKLLPRQHPQIFFEGNLHSIVDYIHGHLDEDLSLNSLANMVQMSSFSLARAFKRSSGITLHQYIIQCRIHKAKQLLANSELSILEISLQVGFQTHSHFTNVFRRLTGITPSQFRGC